jgi:Rv2632c-like
MEQTATWHIEIFLFEDGDRTRANAVLRTSAGTELRHEGVARRNPKDTEVPEIGEELATARALSGLAHDLFEATISDIEQNVHPQGVSRHRTISRRGATWNERIVRHAPSPDRRRRALPMPPVRRSGGSPSAVVERDRQRKRRRKGDEQ